MQVPPTSRDRPTGASRTLLPRPRSEATREGRAGMHRKGGSPSPPLCDIPSGCGLFTGPWTVTRSSLRMLRRVAAFCRLLRPVLLLVSFPRSRGPLAGVLGAVLVAAGVVLQLLLPTPLRIQVIHHMLRQMSMCVRPNCSTPRVLSWLSATCLPTLPRA